MNNCLERAYALLEELTPLTTDCGAVCGGRCCQESADSEGMLLFPGEETFLAEDGYTIRCKAAADITVHMRLKLDRAVTDAEAEDEKGNVIPVACTWDEETSTVLLRFDSTNSITKIQLR